MEKRGQGRAKYKQAESGGAISVSKQESGPVTLPSGAGISAAINPCASMTTIILWPRTQHSSPSSRGELTININ